MGWRSKKISMILKPAGLQKEFQSGQGYKVRPYLTNKQKKKKHLITLWSYPLLDSKWTKNSLNSFERAVKNHEILCKSLSDWLFPQGSCLKPHQEGRHSLNSLLESRLGWNFCKDRRGLDTKTIERFLWVLVGTYHCLQLKSSPYPKTILF